MMRQVALIMSCVALLLVGALAVAGADQKVELYAGSPDQVDLAPWGAGAVEQTDEELYLEAETLRVDTKGFYEGGRLDLKSPMDMNAYLSKPEGGYVLLMVKPAEPKAAEPGGLIGEEGFMPGEEFPMPPGAETMETEEMLEARMMEEAMWEGMPSMMYEEEMMFAPGMEMEGVMPEREAPPPEVQRLRVLLVTDEGELDSGPWGRRMRRCWPMRVRT